MFHSRQGSGEIFHVLEELSRQGFLSTVSLKTLGGSDKLGERCISFPRMLKDTARPDVCIFLVYLF